MHVFGQGDSVTLATALHAGLALSKTPMENAASGAVQPQDPEDRIRHRHSHMLDVQPRLFFMHFWAHDDAAKLAKGLRNALDKINVAKS